MKEICSRARTLIQNRRDGEKPEKSDSLWLSSHLDKCPECALFARQLEALNKACLMLSVDQEFPREAHQSIMKQIRAQSSDKAASADSEKNHMIFGIPRFKPAYALSSAAVFIMLFALSSLMIKTELHLTDKNTESTNKIAAISSPNQAAGASSQSSAGYSAEKATHSTAGSLRSLPLAPGSFEDASGVDAITEGIARHRATETSSMDTVDAHDPEDETIAMEKKSSPQPEITLTRKLDFEPSAKSLDMMAQSMARASKGKGVGADRPSAAFRSGQSFSREKPFRDEAIPAYLMEEKPLQKETSLENEKDKAENSYLLARGPEPASSGVEAIFSTPEAANLIRLVLPSPAQALRSITELCLGNNWSFSVEQIASQAPITQKRIILNLKTSTMTKSLEELRKTIRELNPMIEIFPKSFMEREEQTQVTIIISNVP